MTLTSTLDGLDRKRNEWTEDGECDKAPKAVEIKDGAYAEWNNRIKNNVIRGRGRLPVITGPGLIRCKFALAK